ncbi:MAG: DUF4839 domain-containing protein [Ruminococcus sp.]|nr:DUF4839 domain-containing protein [Ruminococcus sp.]
MSEEIKLIAIVCPKCGAQLKVEQNKKTSFCSFCGTQYFIADASTKNNVYNTTVNQPKQVNIVKKGTVEAVLDYVEKKQNVKKQRIEEEKEKERLRLEKIEEENRIRREKILKFIETHKKGLLIACAILFCWILGAVTQSKPSESSENSKMLTDPTGMRCPLSSDDCEGEDYEDIVEKFRDAGFVNIKTVKIEDLITGWLTSDGEVEEVAINNSTDFEEGDFFIPEAEIIINYHTFPEKEEPTDETTIIETQSSEIQNEPETESETVTELEPEILTVDNCVDLSILLKLDPFDYRVKEFANKYAGKLIEFDGCTAHVIPHGNYKTRFDYLIYACDYDPNTAVGPSFQFRNVNYSDLKLTGDNVPDTFSVGLNIHVIAEVGAYNKNSGLFQLIPVAITMR